MRKIISNIQSKLNNKLVTVKNKIRVFKERVDEEKKKPRSKMRSYLLGFGTVLSIFGVTLFSSSLPVYAKELKPKNTPNPKPSKAPASVVPSEQIILTLSGAAATICGLAVGSGSFLVGAACGIVVVVGILKAQGK